MQIIVTILAGLMGVMGFFTLYAGVTSKHVGIILGGLVYLAGAYFGFSNESLLPVVIAFAAAWVLRKLGADPSP